MSENSNAEKSSKFKTAFQWATAAVATLTGDGPQYGYNVAGANWDYAKTWLGARKAPKLT